MLVLSATLGGLGPAFIFRLDSGFEFSIANVLQVIVSSHSLIDPF